MESPWLPVADWSERCLRLGLEPVVLGRTHHRFFQARMGDWLLTLDPWSGAVVVVFPALYPFRCGLRRTTWWHLLQRRWFDVPQTRLDRAGLDAGYVCEASDPVRLRELAAIFEREALLSTRVVQEFAVTDHLSRYNVVLPEDLDALLVRCRPEALGSDEGLRQIHGVLNGLLRSLSRTESGAGLTSRALLRVLQAPSRAVTDGRTVFWDEIPALRQAVLRLGELRERRALTPLMRMLAHPDGPLRLGAIQALGELGMRSSALALVPLLGEVESDFGGVLGIREAAEAALVRLGECEVVRTVQTDLETGAGLWRTLPAHYHPACCEAFVRALATQHLPSLARAAAALAEAEDLRLEPELRLALRRLGTAQPEFRGCIAAAVDRLSRHLSFPCPAAAPHPHPQDLPGPGSAPGGPGPDAGLSRPGSG